MRGLNLKEIMSKSNMNQQGLNIATYGQAYKDKNYTHILKMETLKNHYGEDCLTPYWESSPRLQPKASG